ncbi:MAG TPA: glycosyltransferase family 9 protein, partial [Salinimicrobium sp.]|nr:glycosyltransferase family 9 protein [Salinimicrobium sp.]
LGNQLLITPLLQEVIATFPNAKIDLFVKGNLAPVLFKNYDHIGRIIKLPKKPFKHLIQYAQVWLAIKRKSYDLVINVDKNSSSGRLATKFSRSRYKFYEDGNEGLPIKNSDYLHIAKYPVLSFRNHLSQLGMDRSEKPIPSMDIKLSKAEILKGSGILKDTVGTEKPTICLFTYATGKKRFSEAWWEEFHARLKSEYKNHPIIEVLPAENVSQIKFTEPTFYSRDVREIASVIENTSIFIGADSGIMHLANATTTPTFGLFSVTKSDKYEPYGNNSRSLDTREMDLNGIFREMDKILKSSE